MSGREITFDELDAGSYFGEISALDGQPRSANVVALQDSLVLSLSRTAFVELLNNNAKLALKVMCRLTSIVRQANERIMDLSTLAAQNRVQAEILRQAHVEASRPNSAVIDPIPIHSDIASRVSTTRETVARVMNDLARKGLRATQARPCDPRCQEAAADGGTRSRLTGANGKSPLLNLGFLESDVFTGDRIVLAEFKLLRLCARILFRHVEVAGASTANQPD